MKVLCCTVSCTVIALLIPLSATVENFWCPPSCHCSDPTRIIDCSSRHLTTIPLVPRNTIRLYLGSNNIVKVSSKDFQNLQQLTYLILSNNQIRFIPEDAFHGLISLKYLVLDSNHLEYLPRKLLYGLKHLSTLSLANNRLISVPKDFLIHSRSLSLLNLQNNELTKIFEGTFSSLSRLHSLNLQQNYFTDDVLKEVSHCTTLCILRLNHNSLSTFKTLSYYKFPALQSLHIASNQITSFSVPLLRDCSKLQLLDVSNNSLVELHRDHFEGCYWLQKIRLNQNKLSNIWAALTDLQNLNSLYLNHNYITNISVTAFKNLTSLKNLYLYGNNLTFLPLEVLQPLHNLSLLHIDPFSCSCSLLPLINWAKQQRILGLQCQEKSGSVISLSLLIETCQHSRIEQNDSHSHKHEKNRPSVPSTSCQPDLLSLILSNTKLIDDEKDRTGPITQKKSNKSFSPSSKNNDREIFEKISSLSKTINGLQDELTVLRRKLNELERLFKSKDYGKNLNEWQLQLVNEN